VVIFVTYEKICEYIYNIPKYTKKNGLEHTRELLDRLGNPQNEFKVIHVAGSNGKGSVCAFVNSVLYRAGKQTGLFTSPHLVCMEERFQMNGTNCTKDDFVAAFEMVKDVVDKMQEEGLAHPAFFEFLFAMGMVIFAKYNMEYVILETGLGGRLDATNIVEKPLLTIITSISLEHTEILGDTLAQIATEKAGILKAGVPIIFDGNVSEASQVICARAKDLKAPYYEVNAKNLKILGITGKNIDFYFLNDYDVVNLQIPFAAEYQMMNAALAYQSLLLLGPKTGIESEQIREGIGKTVWAGRMQEVMEDVYLDGAHNTDGIVALIQTVKRLSIIPPILLFSMVKEKNYQKVIETLAREVTWAQVIVTKIPDSRGLEPEVLAEEFARYSVHVHPIWDCKEAYTYALNRRENGQKLFCAGSLYLIGELEKITGGKEND
jgi:dihydrofolate synthase/folylpolyglutamate synthase